MSRTWVGDGPEFNLEWGGLTWLLKVDGAIPGLREAGTAVGPLLALEGLAERGRCDLQALCGATLAGFERRFGRVEATYTPPNWGELTVRAAWSPSAEDGVDLEIEVSARSVGALKALEVKLLSVLPEPPGGSRRRRWVEPRDARAAAFSYDGREADVRGLTTLPPVDETNPLAPRVIPGPSGDEWSYIEMVHPQDVARRIVEAGSPTRLGHTTRYGLFGHDLERGVVVRGRVRSAWTRSSTPRDEALKRYQRFLEEPLPLGT
jgi:hypothetical protein